MSSASQQKAVLANLVLQGIATSDENNLTVMELEVGEVVEPTEIKSIDKLDENSNVEKNIASIKI